MVEPVEFKVFTQTSHAQSTSGDEHAPCAASILRLFASRPVIDRHEASWRSGYAEDCKSLHPGSIPGEASIPNLLYLHCCRPGFPPAHHCVFFRRAVPS